MLASLLARNRVPNATPLAPNIRQAYGYLTGIPGVCLVVGGPGVLHAMAGIGNASANAWPMLLLAGSCERDLVTKGAFQEMDAISLLMAHTKTAIRATSESIAYSLSHAYRMAYYGRSGTGFVDLPADVIQAPPSSQQTVSPAPRAPVAGADPVQIASVATLFRTARAPLIVIGKGVAYARAEFGIRTLIEHINIPFLPTPMGKGVMPDSHPLNYSSSRSAALKHADVVLLLGARLNWILHFGSPTKWSSDVRFIQVDSSAETIGQNNNGHYSGLGLLGDLNIITAQLITALKGYHYDLDSPYITTMNASKVRNEATAMKAAARQSFPLNYHRVFDIIKKTLHGLSPPSEGDTVYISEGANTMDISRSIFPVEQPRLRLDAGTNATMGVGLGYAIAAYCAYNLPQLGDGVEMNGAEGTSIKEKSHKKIVCFEGDSAFGFSLAEVETMARYRMPILIFVLNNNGIYQGDCTEGDDWLKLQEATISSSVDAPNDKGLRSTSLGWNVKYEQVATMCGGKGFLVRTEEELKDATKEGWRSDVPTVVNVMIESGHEGKLVSCIVCRVGSLYTFSC